MSTVNSMQIAWLISEIIVEIKNGRVKSREKA